MDRRDFFECLNKKDWPNKPLEIIDYTRTGSSINLTTKNWKASLGVNILISNLPMLGPVYFGVVYHVNKVATSSPSIIDPKNSIPHSD